MAQQWPHQRRFQRVKAPVLCRPAGVALRQQREVENISLGGVRVYSDDAHRPGQRLELDLFLPDGEVVSLTAEVVWVDPLPKGSPAKFDVGLKYVDLDPALLERLRSVLAAEDEEST